MGLYTHRLLEFALLYVVHARLWSFCSAGATSLESASTWSVSHWHSILKELFHFCSVVYVCVLITISAILLLF